MFTYLLDSEFWNSSFHTPAVFSPLHAMPLCHPVYLEKTRFFPHNPQATQSCLSFSFIVNGYNNFVLFSLPLLLLLLLCSSLYLHWCKMPPWWFESLKKLCRSASHFSSRLGLWLFFWLLQLERSDLQQSTSFEVQWF